MFGFSKKARAHKAAQQSLARIKNDLVGFTFRAPHESTKSRSQVFWLGTGKSDPSEIRVGVKYGVQLGDDCKPYFMSLETFMEKMNEEKWIAV